MDFQSTIFSYVSMVCCLLGCGHLQKFPPFEKNCHTGPKQAKEPKTHCFVLQWRIQDFPDGGRQPIIWPKFPRKLHENEINWTGGASLAPPLDSPMYFAGPVRCACPSPLGPSHAVRISQYTGSYRVLYVHFCAFFFLSSLFLFLAEIFRKCSLVFFGVQKCGFFSVESPISSRKHHNSEGFWTVQRWEQV